MENVVDELTFGSDGDSDSENPTDNIQFLLYHDPSNKDAFTVLIFNDMESIKMSPFDASKATKVLIDGLIPTDHAHFPQNVKDAYLTNAYKNDFNMTTVNWADLAGEDAAEYFDVYAYLQPVSQRVAEFLLWLDKTMELDLRKNVHLVGHGLGAHIAGLVGRDVNAAGKPLGRVSALDPAGPGYYKDYFDWKLEKTDADFVDVYHTNAGKLGTVYIVGHVDFFINGGYAQPNCPDDPTGQRSHSEAHKIFAQTILDGPNKNDVTQQARNLKANHNDILTGPIIMGEYSLPGTTGSYDVKYNNAELSVAGIAI